MRSCRCVWLRRLSTSGAHEKLKKSEYKFPVFHEGDVEESLAYGDGPGGQKINKTMNAVRLVHLASRITVKVHDTREVEKNRKLAYERLKLKVDDHLNGERSFTALKAQEKVEKGRKLESKAEKLREMKRKFKDIQPHS